jgi:hypothetical protein
MTVLADVGRRRWWPLASALTTDRLKRMFKAAASDMDSRAAALQLAAMLAYTVAGRVVALVILEARAWDPGLENLWVHCDSEGAIDWVGVVDATLRVLPNDPAIADVVRLPSEAALATWTAHRCHRALQPLFSRLHEVSLGALAVSEMWGMAGSAVVTTATRVPLLAGSSQASGMRRGQAVLDALASFGLPVRDAHRKPGAPSRPTSSRRVDTMACHRRNLSSARASTTKSG